MDEPLSSTGMSCAIEGWGDTNLNVQALQRICNDRVSKSVGTRMEVEGRHPLLPYLSENNKWRPRILVYHEPRRDGIGEIYSIFHRTSTNKHIRVLDPKASGNQPRAFFRSRCHPCQSIRHAFNRRCIILCRSMEPVRCREDATTYTERFICCQDL